MELGLRNKVAVIGASSKGLGRAIAHGLAEEGAAVVVCARNTEALEATATEIRENTGSEVMSMAADVSDPHDVENLIQVSIEHFGGIDILVNNAGGPRACLLYTSDAADE